MDIETQVYKLQTLSKINILLGKNGSGKSTILKAVEQGLRGSLGDALGISRYITPERGGMLVIDTNIEQNLLADTTFSNMNSARRTNQLNQFRQQSVAQFRKLEVIVLRELEQLVLQDNADKSKTFDGYITQLNSLLDQIEIKRDIGAFKIFQKGTENPIDPSTISSGEAELISLGIECLAFSKEVVKDKKNLLFFDEPDVHLHPDLQVRFAQFIKKLVEENNFIIILATHSTAFLGALKDYKDINVGFLRTKLQTEIKFQPINEVYRKVLPVFGAHPLSNIFNAAPVLIVEGEDDERIWQTVIRKSLGRIKIYPCECNGKRQMNQFETQVKDILDSVYDNAKGYSLRDRDSNPEAIDDIPPIIRFRLSCRSSENLLLTDETLESLNITWDRLKDLINTWLENNQNQPHFAQLNEFKDYGFDRKAANIKDIRNDLMTIIGSPLDWEIAVGRVIAKLEVLKSTDYDKEGSIYNYLGKKLCENLLPKSSLNSIRLPRDSV